MKLINIIFNGGFMKFFRFLILFLITLFAVQVTAHSNEEYFVYYDNSTYRRPYPTEIAKAVQLIRVKYDANINFAPTEFIYFWDEDTVAILSTAADRNRIGSVFRYHYKHTIYLYLVNLKEKEVNRFEHHNDIYKNTNDRADGAVLHKPKIEEIAFASFKGTLTVGYTAKLFDRINRVEYWRGVKHKAKYKERYLYATFNPTHLRR